MKKILTASLLALASISFMSCIRPYDKPEYIEIDPNETAFVIPLFTDSTIKTEDQVQLNDAEYYKNCAVSQKLIQVPHKWIKTGRFANSGYYTGTVKVITVDLTPHAGRWEANDDMTAIKVETAASQGITIPMSYTMHIEPADAATYLSHYRAVDFDSVINVQINRYFAGVVGKYFHETEYKDIAAKRDEMLEKAVSETKEHFKAEGITIDALAIIDGLIYDDRSLQENIDQQAKVQAQIVLENQKAELLSQQRKNETYEAETKRQTMELQRTTMNIEQDKLDREQKRKNEAAIAAAQAEAIKNGKYAPVPQTLIVQDLDTLGAWNPSFMN